MNLIALIAAPVQQLTTNVQHDERLLQHVERGWKESLTDFVQFGVPKLLVALLLAFAFQATVNFFVRRMNKRAEALVGNSRRAAQLRTMAAILRATAYAITGFYLFTQVLSALGVSLGPFIASAGVIGLGISFGAQSIFKDMLTGIFILIEDQYSVGATIRSASLTGTVEDLSLRVTRLRDGDGTLNIVPNSQITTVSNLSRDYSVGVLNVSVDAREDPDRVVAVLRDVAAQVRRDEAFKDIIIAEPNVLGVDKITGYEVIYPIVVRVMVNQRDGVLRAIRRRVLQAFAAEKISFGASSATILLTPTAEQHAAAQQAAQAQTPPAASAAKAQ